MKNKLAEIYDSSRIKSFLFSMMLFGIVIGLYNGVFNNYLHEILGLTKAERGWLELPRELPGLLIFAILALLTKFTEIRLIKLAFLITSIGLAGLFFFGESKAIAIILLAVYSTGEHMMMPVRQSVGLHMAKSGKEGAAMGLLRSFGNAGQAIGFYVGPLLLLLAASAGGNSFFRYRIVFLAAFIILVTALIVSSFLKKGSEKVNRKKIHIDKKYTRYYLLEVFFGARKQVFLTFAPYVLITVYDAGPGLISMLYGLWSVINIFIGPAVGRMIDRFGYKRVLIFDAVVLILICLVYGFAHRIFAFETAFILICVVFVLDAVMFAFGMARDMYARSLAVTKDELTSTLATGLSVNHLVSIVIAIFGGLLWERMGMEYLFTFAAVLGMGSLIFSAKLQKPEKTLEMLQ
ncbi:MAG: MFS transporter [Spirochaetales bacterium]|nr:MFS transporter [Spirochaetales bacterium]